MTRRPLPAALALATALALSGCAADDPAPAAGTATADEMTSDTEDMADEDMSEQDTMADEDMSEQDTMADEAVPAVYDFAATTLDGEEFDGASLAGSPAVLWFWAPWCPTCIMQIPAVTGLAEEYGDDVAVVGVGGLDDASAISEMAEENIDGITHLVDDAGEVWQHFGMTQQSTFVVLDADGEIVAEGVLTEPELESAVADLAG
ncbi:thiol-disulfide isomerase/thioredoxin [Isoptericola sp. CG 20/1183]|uniref:Thiol-disulfide isomerase/thioredoxin n=1 Tax=Isoptericola halotolerans TaxID=300560 RepID=A0ABX5EI81_9MICO|nr:MULTISPECIES: redoxin family protein [Isoptericola]PRZ07021.1 thiol-disulfide isomerase/thioredoxin [Isoptericola halotolerans]PRZ07307.1 thiol-disulfide isomerase/thioredoxin [Isoptericola sp. CG 20/1183]